MENEDLLRAELTRTFLSNTYRRYGVHSLGVGLKQVGGAFTDTPALVFFVSSKLPETALDPSQRIPTELRVVRPETEEEVRLVTDVVASPPPILHSGPPGAAHRPAPGGVRIHMAADPTMAGTLGGWVWDKTDDSIVFLTNRHVVGNSVGAVVNQGSSGTLPPGATLRFGTVKRLATWIPASGTPPYPESQCNYADAAVCAVDDVSDAALTVRDIGLAVFQTGKVQLLNHVETFGAITEYQQGRVTTVPITFAADIDGVGTIGFCDGFRIEPLEADGEISSKGDSGKLVFRKGGADDPNVCIGLLFAGGGSSQASNNYGICNRIENVFAEMKVDVLCSGGVQAFLDAIFDSNDSDGAIAVNTFRVARTTAVPFHRGIARDVEARLMASSAGRQVTDFAHTMRADLFQLVVHNGDVRRAVVHALGPILRGAVTMDQLFQRRLSKDDIDRLDLMFDTWQRQGPDRLAPAVKLMRSYFKLAEGQTISDLFPT